RISEQYEVRTAGVVLVRPGTVRRTTSGKVERWRRDDPERYAQTLASLGQARDDLLDRFKELMNTMSQQGHMSDPPQPSQAIQVTTGDSSPVSINAPYASATGSGSATTGVPQPAADTASPWYRSGVVWTAVGSIAAVVTVIVTIVLAQ
ncbi:hypothetical protein ACWCOW_39990, partial [Streptomyces sp. NPDC001939]